MDEKDFESSIPKIPTEIVYYKTRFPNPSATESKAKNLEMIYDRTPSLLPKNEEWEPVKAGVIEGSPGGMQYYKTFPDPLDVSEFKVNLSKQENELYPSMAPGNDIMAFSGVSGFLKGEFEKALDKGGDNFTKSLGHYEKVITEGDIFRDGDPHFQDGIRSLFSEARELGNKEALATFWERVESFLVGIELNKK
jgi:hypothetical protein